MPEPWLLVPVKRLDRAKTRLGGRLAPRERHDVALAMAEHVVAVAAGLGMTTLLVTDDPEVAALGRAAGLDVLPDVGHDHSSAIRSAAAWCARRGAPAVATVAADLPLLAAGDVARLVAALAPGRALVLAPDRAGTGTNAVVAAPPDFAFAFGPGSLRRHVAIGRADGRVVRVVRTVGLGTDVDEPDDLTRWRAHPVARAGVAPAGAGASMPEAVPESMPESAPHGARSAPTA